MQLHLNEQWEIDNKISRKVILSSRLYPAIYGGIIGETFASVSKTNPAITGKVLRLMEGFAEKKVIPEIIGEFGGTDLITYISPLVFTFADRFDFPHLVKAVESFTAIIGDDDSTALGCIIYLEILFRLFHNDDFNRALDITNELCTKFLVNTKYEQELGHYKHIFCKQIQAPATRSISPGNDTARLERALWCCLHNSGFENTVLDAVNRGGDCAATASLAGTLAGIYYKGDFSKMLPKARCNYEETLARFLDYCTENAPID